MLMAFCLPTFRMEIDSDEATDKAIDEAPESTGGADPGETPGSELQRLNFLRCVGDHAGHALPPPRPHSYLLLVPNYLLLVPNYYSLPQAIGHLIQQINLPVLRLINTNNPIIANRGIDHECLIGNGSR